MSARAGLRVKICGLRNPEHVRTAAEAGAAYVGFVFFPPSPRALAPEDAAMLCAETPPGVAKVGLFVDPADAMLDATLAAAPLDMLQLHGSETPARLAEIRGRFGLPIIKAIGVGSAADVAGIEAFEGVADQILCDAKPAPTAVVPGGAGHPFEWALLAGRRWRRPWLLAGGLTAANVAEAVRAADAAQVDVSSGVEARRGEKSAELIRGFCSAAAVVPPA